MSARFGGQRVHAGEARALQGREYPRRTADRLRQADDLEIWTDGTISPEMALVEASTILPASTSTRSSKYFDLVKQIRDGRREHSAAALEAGEDSNVRELREKLTQPVSVLDPSVRAENCMAAANIQILADLCA